MNYKLIILAFISMLFLFAPELFAITVSDMSESLNKNDNKKMIILSVKMIGFLISIFMYFYGFIGIKKYADDQSRPVAKYIVIFIFGFLFSVLVTLSMSTNTYCYHSHYDENFNERGF